MYRDELMIQRNCETLELNIDNKLTNRDISQLFIKIYIRNSNVHMITKNWKSWNYNNILICSVIFCLKF